MGRRFRDQLTNVMGWGVNPIQSLHAIRSLRTTWTEMAMKLATFYGVTRPAICKKIKGLARARLFELKRGSKFHLTPLQLRLLRDVDATMGKSGYSSKGAACY